MDWDKMDFETLELPKNSIEYPRLYAPPVTKLPEDDSIESAKAVLDRQRYESLLANVAPLREAYLSNKEKDVAGFDQRMEQERLAGQGVTLPEGPIPEAAKIPGAVNDYQNQISSPPQPETGLEELTKNMPSFVELKGAALQEGEDTPESVKALEEMTSRVGEVREELSKAYPTAIKVVDGKKFISKKFVEENKDILKGLANSFGFESSKDVLEALMNYNDIKTGVGTTKFGKNEYAGDKMTNLPKGEVEGKTLILPDEWDSKALKKAEEIAQAHGMKTNEFFAFIDHETGGTFSPKVTNNIGATGLIQFTGETAYDTMQLKKRAEELNKLEAEGTKITPKMQNEINKKYPFRRELTSNAEKQKAWKDSQFLVANMSLEDQLDLIDVYLEHATRGKKGLDNVYSTVFAGSPTKQSIPMSEGNEGLDKDGNGVISREEFISPVKDKLKYKEVKVRDEVNNEA